MVIVWRGCFLFHLSFWDRGVHLIIYGIRGFFETTLLVLCSRRWVDTARGTRYAEIVLKQSISRLTQCYCASRRLPSKQNEHSFVWFSLKNKNQFIFEGRRRNCQVKKFKLYWLPCLNKNTVYTSTMRLWPRCWLQSVQFVDIYFQPFNCMAEQSNKDKEQSKKDKLMKSRGRKIGYQCQIPVWSMPWIWVRCNKSKQELKITTQNQIGKLNWIHESEFQSFNKNFLKWTLACFSSDNSIAQRFQERNKLRGPERPQTCHLIQSKHINLCRIKPVP
jgi:hypothetical protein